jgi:hypothetical protein
VLERREASHGIEPTVRIRQIAEVAEHVRDSLGRQSRIRRREGEHVELGNVRKEPVEDRRDVERRAAVEDSPRQPLAEGPRVLDHPLVESDAEALEEVVASPNTLDEDPAVQDEVDDVSRRFPYPVPKGARGAGNRSCRLRAATSKSRSGEPVGGGGRGTHDGDVSNDALALVYLVEPVHAFANERHEEARRADGLGCHDVHSSHQALAGLEDA